MAGRLQNVQLVGIDKTVQAYIDQRIPAFSVGDGNDINIRYNEGDLKEGAQLLKLWLQRLDETGTQQLYQLRLYEGLQPGQKITKKTLHDLAFNFRLRERETMMPAVAGAGGALNTSQLLHLMNEMQELKVQNALLAERLLNSSNDEDDEEEEKTEPGKVIDERSAGQKIGQAMIDQAIPVIGQIFRSIAGKITGNESISQSLAGASIGADERKLIDESIERLSKSIPATHSIGGLLKKLADLSEKNPTQFQSYLGIMMSL